MGAASTTLIAYPPRFDEVKLIRSTLLVSSFAAVKEMGYGDRYLAALPQEFHSIVLRSVAGMWLPLDVGMAHYRACDALALSPEREVELGRAVGERVKGTLLGTVVKMAKEVGMTPSTVIAQFPRFWARAYEGGGMGATLVGPKEVHLGVQKVPFADLRYFRNTLRGLTMGVLDMFCTRSYISELKTPRAPGTVTYRVQWA